MPHQPTITEIRTSNIVTGLRLAITVLEELNDALGTSSLQAISQRTVSLITAIQVRKSLPSSINITWDFRMSRKTKLDVLSSWKAPMGCFLLLSISTSSQTYQEACHCQCWIMLPSSQCTLPASWCMHYECLIQLRRTTHKIHTYLEAQQEGSRLRNFFHQNELNTLLKDCQAGLQHAVEVFKASTSTKCVEPRTQPR